MSGHSTIPHPEKTAIILSPEACKNIETGGANSWAGMAVDTRRGIIYIPTGSPVRFYGGNREGKPLCQLPSGIEPLCLEKSGIFRRRTHDRNGIS